MGYKTRPQRAEEQKQESNVSNYQRAVVRNLANGETAELFERNLPSFRHDKDNTLPRSLKSQKKSGARVAQPYRPNPQEKKRPRRRNFPKPVKRGPRSRKTSKKSPNKKGGNDDKKVATKRRW